MLRPTRCLRLREALSLVSLLIALVGTASSDDTLSRDYFETHIRPLLVDACVKCHDANEQSGNLRLDSREHLLRGGDSGQVIVPGDPANSLIVKAVKRDGELSMPPDHPLNQTQINRLEHWIETGASWPEVEIGDASSADPHWSFQRIVKPEIPPVPPSDAVGSDWVQSPIDAFVLRTLLANGLLPSPKADRRVLIRRASFDLTGLPPTAEEVDAFVNDPSPDAWPRLINRLLDSPHYGEKWGRHWLDVARYSDSKGYVYAREERFWVHAWAYRDWVVRAMNEDLPYDRFLLLQIAADQADCDQRDLAAMGFLTLGRRFLGVPHDIIDDRIDVLTRGTMGLTVACARCHDHKYDPIPTEDYYAMYGVFRNCDERLVELEAIENLDSEFAKGLAERKEKLDEAMTKHRTSAADRVRKRLSDYLAAQLRLQDYPEAGFDQIYVESDIIPQFVRRWQEFLDHQAELGDSVFEAWRRFQALPTEQFSQQAASICDAIGSATQEEIHPRVAALFVTPPSRMQEVATSYSELLTEVDAEWQAAGGDVGQLISDPLLRVLHGPGSPCEVPAEPIVNIELFFPTEQVDELWKLQGDIDRWLMNSAGSTPHALILVDKDGPSVNARLMRRGDPRLLGDRVPRQFLSLVSGPEPQPFQHGSGRLELANHIASADNPLTARVAVNRIWMHHFGLGLVPTPSDFGRRADPPSHPELLDWLAAAFIEGSWHMKPMHRMIMMSSAYQQASSPHSHEAYARGSERDPANRWLWRYSPRRLTFEELRDASLAVTGELDASLGGKPEELLSSTRRTLYAKIDRQFFSSLMRAFDVASPDLHIARRAETTSPQQALFFLNHPFVVQRARELAKRSTDGASDDAMRVRNLYRAVYQREPTESQSAASLEMITVASQLMQTPPEVSREWSYGLGEFNVEEQRVNGFKALPYFDGKAWQGGPAYPDPTLGWVQLTAEGGHPGNVMSQGSIRRWTAPRSMRIKIESNLTHEPQPGDGIRAYLVSSNKGLLKSADVHQSSERLDVNSLALDTGDTLDFAVDILSELNSDQYLWTVTITEHPHHPADDHSDGDHSELGSWDSQRDFGGPPTAPLEPWEQLAQVLLSANEFAFTD